MKDTASLKAMIRNVRVFLPFLNKGLGADVLEHQCELLEDALRTMHPVEARIGAEVLRQLVDHYLYETTFNWEPSDGDFDFKTNVVALGMYGDRPKLKERDIIRWDEVVKRPYVSWEARQYAASKTIAEGWLDF